MKYLKIKNKKKKTNYTKIIKYLNIIFFKKLFFCPKTNLTLENVHINLFLKWVISTFFLTVIYFDKITVNNRLRSGGYKQEVYFEE